MAVDKRRPEFTYRIGGVRIVREMILIEGASCLVLHYSIKAGLTSGAAIRSSPCRG
ncbi:MAG: hypothetical protein LBS77_02180 [Desulfovibrio sp.]|jgi:hypothetical protein|nr:hypothetical protein [Desulfovibrio sp.]